MARRWVWAGLGLLVGLPVVLCAGLGAFGATRPQQVELEVVETLAAPPNAVRGLLDDVDGLQRWWGTAMAAYAETQGGGPTMTVVHVEGTPRAGPGTRVRFEAGGMTAEAWEILRVTDDTVVYDVDFQMFRVERTLTLEPDGGSTRVTWHEVGFLGNPWLRGLAALSGGDEGAKANFRMALDALEEAAR